jgi:hypothetical protein
MALSLEQVTAEPTRALAHIGFLGLFNHLGKSSTFPDIA